MSGVFDSVAHQQEIQLLIKGRLKQFEVVAVPLDTAGIVKNTGGDQGQMEVEGSGLVVLSSYVNKDRTVFSSFVGTPVYVRFNHPEAPFVPIGIPDSTQATVQPWPSSYGLTIGRVWFFVPTTSVNANKVIYLAVVKGVTISGAAGLSAAGQASTYSSPAQNSAQPNPWGSGLKGSPSF